ncbi:FixH family protein [Novosphingobium kaempferiae]|uniref:FixH family protein n=1 Tax=Novosphingobium kaempferiae TaxID=2896849 RepID=UPI001E4C3678|nr:FixH family protein [Novosphingobium kaempferiae]
MTVQTRKPFSGQNFTGGHMTAILVAGFGVVVAVNVTMATLASTTFGGIVVENSYVASQDFNRWLDEAAREKALGWRLDARRGKEGRVVVDLGIAPSILRQAQDERNGDNSLPMKPAQAEPVEAPAARATLIATARHPLGRLPDVALTFRHEGTRWISTQPLPAGRWILRFEVEAQGRHWRTQQEIGA